MAKTDTGGGDPDRCPCTGGTGALCSTCEKRQSSGK